MHRVLCYLQIFALWLIGASIVLAQEGQTAPEPYSASLSGEISLPNARFELNNPAHFDLPALPEKPGQAVVLRARIYIKIPTSDGFNGHAQIRFNGIVLSRYMPDGSERLLFRKPTFTFQKQKYPVFSVNSPAQDLLNTMFAISAQVADQMTSDQLGGTFMLNLSDKAKSSDTNALEVVGNATAASLGEGQVEDASVGWIDQTLLTLPISGP